LFYTPNLASLLASLINDQSTVIEPEPTLENRKLFPSIEDTLQKFPPQSLKSVCMT